MATSFANQALALALKALLDNSPAAVEEINKHIEELDKISALDEGDEGMFMGDLLEPYEADQISMKLKDLIGTEYEEPVENKKQKAFWIVWGPKGQTNPKCRYYTKSGAENAAREMTLRHGQTFYVMLAQSEHMTETNVVTNRLD